jgi:hypothetical protein
MAMHHRNGAKGPVGKHQCVEVGATRNPLWWLQLSGRI